MMDGIVTITAEIAVNHMRVLIDILHPAHVHFFRNFYAEMESRGHKVCITARDKDRSVELLRAYDLPYQQISQQKTGCMS